MTFNKLFKVFLFALNNNNSCFGVFKPKLPI